MRNITFLISLLICLNGFSQGEFLHKGQNGLQLDGYFLEYSKSEMSGFGGKIGFSIKGIFDLQGNVNGWSMPSGVSGADFSGRRVYGRMVLHALKQSDKMPVSVRGIAGYGYQKGKDIDYTVNEFDFGLGVSRRTYLQDNISFVPTVDFMYVFSSFSAFSQDAVKKNHGRIAMSLPVAFNLPHNHLVHFAPFINFGLKDSGGSYGFNLGYIIPFYPK